jgi:hypothetical protein
LIDIRALLRHDPSFPFVELAAEEIALRSEPAGKGPFFTLGRSQIQQVWEVENRVMMCLIHTHGARSQHNIHPYDMSTLKQR